MIIHIANWIAELRRLREDFDTACTDNDDVSIERALYYSAFVLRKISETPFASRNLLGKSLKVNIYEPSLGAVDALSWLEAEVHFDFKTPRSTRAPLKDVCNAIIHSLFLNWRPSSGQVQEILVAGGARARAEAIGFAPREYATCLRYVERYPFKDFALPTARRE